MASASRSDLGQLQGPQRAADSLWTPGTFQPDAVPHWARVSFDAVLPYVQEFLTAPHPYRRGTMCPYVPAALRRHAILFGVGSVTRSETELIDATKGLVDAYLDQRSRRSGPGAMIILFPEDSPPDRLLAAHRTLKVYCVERHLMIGALYPESDAWSLHERTFFPLRTPVPTFVVRDLVLPDLMFLDDQPHGRVDRMRFLAAFIRKFGVRQRHAERQEVVEARALLRRYRIRTVAIWSIRILALGLVAELARRALR